MVAYLRAQQFTEQNGWHPADPVYGAWGMGGGRRTPPDTGHVDLSMTRYVLEALRDAGLPASDQLFEHARVFVERCQNFDPKRPDDATAASSFRPPSSIPTKPATTANTSEATERPRPMASWRCWPQDAQLDDPRIAAAERWLSVHHRDMDVPGFVGGRIPTLASRAAFYYSSATAQAFRSLHLQAGSGIADALKTDTTPRWFLGEPGKSGERR